MLVRTNQIQPLEGASPDVGTSAALFRLLSHDLRNPLANIITTSSFYLDEEIKLSEDRKSSLVKSMHTDATQLLAQIENILSLSRLTQSPVEMSIAEFDAVISRAVRRTRSKYPHRTFTIVSALDSLAFPMEPALLEHAIMLLLKLLHERLEEGILIQCMAEQKEDHVLLTLQALPNTMVLPTDSPITCSSDVEICELIIQAHHGTLHTLSAKDAPAYKIELPMEVI